MPAERGCILWTGPKRSGKTTAAASLIGRARAAGAAVWGVLAEAVRDEGGPAGFDVVDLAGGGRAPLARRGGAGPERTGPFAFTRAGLELGRAALARAGRRGLVVVDEYGPLELAGGGWRRATDDLLARGGAVVLLVVREALAGEVARLYAAHRPLVLRAGSPGAADAVLEALDARGETGCVHRGS